MTEGPHRREGAPLRSIRGVRAVFFVHGMLFASWVAHIPQVKAHLRLGLGPLGVALLGAPVGSILAMAAAGHLVPRLGSRRVVRAGMVGYCLTGAALGTVGSLPAFFLVFMAWGLFQGALEVAMNTQGVAVERAERRSVMPTFHGSWSLGALVGAGIGTAGVALGVSLTGQLVVLGAISLAAVTALTGALLADDGDEQSGAAGSDAASASAGLMDDAACGEPGRGRLTRPRWVTPALLLLCGIALADMLCEGAAADWSAVYLRSSFEAPGPVVGLGYTLYSLVMVTTRFAGPRLLTRWTPGHVLPSLSALATVGFAVALAVPGTAVTLVAFCCLGAGCALVIPTTYSGVGETSSANPGRAVALVSGIGWVGFLAGPPLIGQIASVTSLRVALVVIPVLTALITVAMIAMARPSDDGAARPEGFEPPTF